MGRGLVILGILAAVALGLWVYNWERKPSSQLPEEIGTLNAKALPWSEYISPLGQFKVLLPSHPHHSRESHDRKEYEIFLAPRDEATLYSINLISLPLEDGNTENFLEKFMGDMLKNNPQNLVKNMHKGKFQNENAYDFTVSSQGTQITGKAFLIDKTLYVLSVTNKDGELNPQEFDFFIKSFQLKTPPAAIPAK